MDGRIGLVKKEVEGRGYKWDDAADMENGGDEHNGHVVNGHPQQAEGQGDRQAQVNGSGGSHSEEVAQRRLTDEELTRRLREQMGEDIDEEDGVHL